jgi:hypothetical protein
MTDSGYCDNPYPVDSGDIALADVDVADDVIAKIKAAEAMTR